MAKPSLPCFVFVEIQLFVQKISVFRLALFSGDFFSISDFSIIISAYYSVPGNALEKFKRNERIFRSGVIRFEWREAGHTGFA